MRQPRQSVGMVVGDVRPEAPPHGDRGGSAPRQRRWQRAPVAGGPVVVAPSSSHLVLLAEPPGGLPQRFMPAGSIPQRREPCMSRNTCIPWQCCSQQCLVGSRPEHPIPR